jgi:hypothetical protein
MEIQTNGSILYFSNPNSSGVFALANFGCIPDTIDLGQDNRNITSIPCMNGETKKVAGSVEYGDTSITIVLDDANTTYTDLITLSQKQVLDKLYFCICDDGTDLPTIDPATGIITPPNTRSALLFQGELTSVGYQMAISDLWRCTINISRVSAVSFVPKP